MEKTQLDATLSDSANKQLQNSTAQQRIMECILKKFPITDAIFEGLDLIKDDNKERLLKNAEELIKLMEMPINASLSREIEKTSMRIKAIIEQLASEDSSNQIDDVILATLNLEKKENSLNDTHNHI